MTLQIPIAARPDQFFSLLLLLEGTDTNIPQDHGGATRWGVTEVTLRAYDPTLDIATLTREDAKKLYAKLYYSKVRLMFDTPTHYHYFDLAVNSGLGSYQKAYIYCDRDLHLLIAWRKRKFENIVAARPDQKIFLDGWLHRIDRINQYFQV